MPKLYMLVGISGSGKSTWAQNMAVYSEGEVVAYSSDDLREELFGDVNEQGRNAELFEELHKRIIKALTKDYIVCYDATNLSSKRRMAFLNLVRTKVANCQCEAIIFPVLPEVALERNAARERHVPEEVILHQLRQFEMPQWYEGWDNIHIWSQLNNKIKMLDMIAALRDLPHDNSKWHARDVLNHTMAVYDAMCKAKPYDKIAQLTALLHDIGKPYTKVFHNSKGEPTAEAHYYGHDNVGAYLSLLVDKSFYGYIEETDIRIAQLIALHDKTWGDDGTYWSKLKEKLDPLDVGILETLRDIDREYN